MPTFDHAAFLDAIRRANYVDNEHCEDLETQLKLLDIEKNETVKKQAFTDALSSLDLQSLQAIKTVSYLFYPYYRAPIYPEIFLEHIIKTLNSKPKEKSSDEKTDKEYLNSLNKLISKLLTVRGYGHPPSR